MTTEKGPRILPAVRRFHSRLAEVRTEARRRAREKGQREKLSGTIPSPDQSDSLAPAPESTAEVKALAEKDGAESPRFIAGPAGTVRTYGDQRETDSTVDGATSEADPPEEVDVEESSEPRCPMCEQSYEGSLGRYRGFDMCTVCVETLKGRLPSERQRH